MTIAALVQHGDCMASLLSALRPVKELMGWTMLGSRSGVKYSICKMSHAHGAGFFTGLFLFLVYSGHRGTLYLSYSIQERARAYSPPNTHTLNSSPSLSRPMLSQSWQHIHAQHPIMCNDTTSLDSLDVRKSSSSRARGSTRHQRRRSLSPLTRCTLVIAHIYKLIEMSHTRETETIMAKQEIARLYVPRLQTIHTAADAQTSS